MFKKKVFSPIIVAREQISGSKINYFSIINEKDLNNYR